MGGGGGGGEKKKLFANIFLTDFCPKKIIIKKSVSEENLATSESIPSYQKNSCKRTEENCEDKRTEEN